MRKLIARVAAALLAAVLVFPCGAISAGSAVLLDAQTERLLFEQNANKRSLIASTTKIMTALVVVEQCNVLDRVRIPEEAVGIEGSSMYLREGEILTVQELLYGLMLRSGNDAATALAIYCGGTVEGFAELMNDKARRLGLTGSHFVNPHGLDHPDHYATAADLAKLAAYAMENPIFAQTVSTKTVKMGQRQLQNHNKLLWQLDGADGVKTGFTKAAGRILVSSCTRQGRRLIAVTINDGNDWADHKNLHESGFSTFSLQKIVSQGECLATTEVVSAQQKAVQLIAREDFYYPLRPDESVQLVIPGPGFVYAPVVEGQEAGVAYLYLENKIVGQIPLEYGNTVERLSEENTSLFKRIFGGKKK
ncbi:MAG: D-alanyl-D-alanine carboxypeptidase [Oscillospiraceae bacterium]|nr:D-alanyl-D-alanine carboxypeptidase [Oscillospiraceae bacterium]